MTNIPVSDQLRQLKLENDILRTGYQECINDLEASNKLLVVHLGMDPVQLTGEVLGHQSVLNGASAQVMQGGDQH